MKILHTADWHLGKKLEQFSRLEEQKEVLEEICEIADKEKVHAVIIAGDLFDTYNPPTEAVDLFYKTLKKLSNNGNRAVVAISGNHDSPERIEAPDPLARECGIIFAGYPNSCITPFELDSGLKVLQSTEGFVELKLPKISHPLRLILTPYANEQRLKTFLSIEDSEEEMRKHLEKKWKDLSKKYCDNKGVNMLATHLFLVKKGDTPPEEPEDEKPILHVGGAQAVYTSNIPKEMQYVALGHLHGKRMAAEDPCPMLYSSSILSYSMSEAEQEKHVIIIDAKPDAKVKHKSVSLKKGKTLIRKRFEDIDEAVQFLNENKESYIELTLKTKSFLTADNRKRLEESHNSLVAIIPEIESMEDEFQTKVSPDLNKDIESLFQDYFEYKHGQEVNEDVIAMFREIMGR